MLRFKKEIHRVRGEGDLFSITKDGRNMSFTVSSTQEIYWDNDFMISVLLILIYSSEIRPHKVLLDGRTDGDTKFSEIIDPYESVSDSYTNAAMIIRQKLDFLSERYGVNGGKYLLFYDSNEWSIMHGYPYVKESDVKRITKETWESNNPLMLKKRNKYLARKLNELSNRNKK